MPRDLLLSLLFTIFIMGLDSGGKHGVRDMIKTQNFVTFTLIYIDAQVETVSVVCRYALLT